MQSYRRAWRQRPQSGSANADEIIRGLERYSDLQASAITGASGGYISAFLYDCYDAAAVGEADDMEASYPDGLKQSFLGYFANFSGDALCSWEDVKEWISANGLELEWEIDGQSYEGEFGDGDYQAYITASLSHPVQLDPPNPQAVQCVKKDVVISIPRDLKEVANEVYSSYLPDLLRCLANKSAYGDIYGNGQLGWMSANACGIFCSFYQITQREFLNGGQDVYEAVISAHPAELNFAILVPDNSANPSILCLRNEDMGYEELKAAAVKI